MKHKSLPVVVGLLMAVAACGPAKVDVAIQIATVNPETGDTTMAPGKNIEVRMVPFNRDSVFDSLSTAFGKPEPPIPASVMAQRDTVRAAEQRWRNAELRWSSLRDTLQKLNTAMKKYSRGEREYVKLFNDWNNFDGQLSQVNRVKDQYFKEFTTAQQVSSASSDSIKVIRDNWANEAFKNVDKVFAAKLKALGLKIADDTTDANGATEFKVNPGRWWITARYDLLYTQLYWNLPVDVKRGKPLQVILTRKNATEREKL